MTERRVEIRRNTSGSPWTYELLDLRQREIGREVEQGAPGALLLSELAPVITFGRRAGESELKLPASSLSQLGISVFPTDRGGLATYHGPGQWVLFAVDRLERLTGDSRGVRRAVEALLETALAVGRRYDPSAEIREGCELGVWTSRGKFAAVGVQVKDRVLYHGLSVNAFSTPQSFVGLRPCGLDAPVDYLLRNTPEADKGNEFDRLGRALAEEALARFWVGSAGESCLRGQSACALSALRH